MNERDTLEILLGEFHTKLSTASKGLQTRDAIYPEAPSKIKVAVGMRRSGKTYFNFQEIHKLLSNDTPLSRILYINFEDDRLLPLNQQKLAKLIEAFYEIYPENHEYKCYLFLDEIQNVTDWPIVVRRFHDSKNLEIYLTGSSAKLLSKEIATSLRGRALETEIWPYSFKEFLSAKSYQCGSELYDKKTQDTLTSYFKEYLACGGFPEVTNFDANVRLQTLQEYIDVAIYRDIVERHNISHPAFIKYMIVFMLSNVSRPFSINKFFNESRQRGYKISRDVLYEYVEYIADAYLAFLVGIYDESIRKVQTNPKKIFAIDPGIVTAVTLNTERDECKLLENVVYLELRRQNCKVHYYLTKQRYEVDFLVQTLQGKLKLFQVCWDLSDPNTRDREQRALEQAQKELNIDGEIITLDSFLRNGIVV